MTAHPPAPRRSAAEQRKLDEALTDLFERKISFNQVLGLKVLTLGPGGAQLPVAPRRGRPGPPGVALGRPADPLRERLRAPRPARPGRPR